MPHTMDVPDTQDLIEAGMQTVETLMYATLDSDVAVLRDASRHILQAGGKRVRPRMVLLSYAACGGQDFDLVAPIAAALELVHTASVVHDDINDHGVVRRGRPSVNALWGRTFALLTGDFLFTKVYELMSPFKDLNVLMAEATIALVEGETLQAAAVKDNNLTRKTYMDIIGRKTAALFKAAGLMGAKMANATEPQVDALGMYGFNLGLAFQIVDDILDLTADSDQLGKTSGIDIEQGKGLAAAYAAETTPEAAADPLDAFKRKLLEGSAIQEGQMQARQLMQMAADGLAVLPDTQAKAALLELGQYVINRDH
ncbi:MAG: polyprenyl synthetase family protein [Armatimonadetes bacterium]|nr:polyprenyl synthetase family protein [Anaerolineae bacterium]